MKVFVHHFKNIEAKARSQTQQKSFAPCIASKTCQVLYTNQDDKIIKLDQLMRPNISKIKIIEKYTDDKKCPMEKTNGISFETQRISNEKENRMRKTNTEQINCYKLDNTLNQISTEERFESDKSSPLQLKYP